MRLERKDITTYKVDAIVNAANAALSGGGGVDGAIHRAAGPKLLDACRKLGRCPPGDAIATPGFDLPAQIVIHAVGPVWRGGAAGEAEMLTQCYRRSIEVAVENGVETIVFPAISCGVYRYPLDQAAEIAVRTLRACKSSISPDMEMIITCIEPKTYRAFEKAVASNV